MSLLPRLTRATRALTGKERVILHLQAHREGRKPDPDLQHFEDERERRQYDRYMGLVYVANADLGLYLGVLKDEVEQLASGRQVFEVLRDAAQKAAKEEGVAIDWRRARRAHERKGELGLTDFLANLSEQARELAAETMVLRWKELQALEHVWSAMTEEFDATDPVDPQLRRTAEELKALLRELAQRVGLSRLPEPEQPYIDRLWELVDQVYDTLKLVKEEP